MTTQSTQPENDDIQVTVVEESSASNSPATGDSADPGGLDQVKETQPPTPELPFTAFIEEFRQREERLSAAGGAAPSLLPEASKDLPDSNNNVSHAEEQPETFKASATQDTPDQAGSRPAEAGDSIVAPLTPMTPSASVERPVSPLLRPATPRIRVPRQGGGRQRENFVTQASSAARAETPTPQDTPTAQVEQSPVPTVEEPRADEGAAQRPARRYRFDRRTPNVQSTAPVKPATATPSSARDEESKDASLPSATAAHAENTQTGAVDQPRAANVTANAPVEAQTSNETKTTVPSPESETTATPARANNDRRRRHGQESQRAKEPSATSTTITPTPVTQITEEPVPVAQVETPIVPEASVEDLPPLEYAELQAASRRRRRRRPNGPGPNGNAATPTPATRAAVPQTTVPAPATLTTPTTPAPGRTIATPPVPMPPTPAAPISPAAAYTIQSGATVSQMNQGNDITGPFQGPEPSPARGSVFPTQNRLVRPLRNGSEVQRPGVPGTSAARGGDGLLSTGAVNHLANVISQAIQIQSDRMAAELRRSTQTPANISVTLPPFPSTERVGVFVDVANLLYSARTLRMTIDFGKLLDFLRGNRRLVRAHAYCPTSPQPGDDQMFLQAVKGLGYRITTKNYKTFASGAKKADMDLDLCMDVVRLVDGNAVDCVVLVSGDSDFMPMLDYCSDHGVRVEIAAFDESMSATLRQSCDLFINLSMLDEIRVP